MRRLAVSMVTALGAALLSACSGGGSAFSTGTNTSQSISQVVFSNGSGQTNDFFVAPGGTAPLRITAVGQKGSGPSAVLVPDALFTWAARFVNPKTDTASVANYATGTSPNGFKTCPAVPVATPAIDILQAGAGGVNPVYNGAFTKLPDSQAASTVYLGPVKGITPPYCVLVQATHLGDGVIGAKTVVVSSSP